MNIQFFGAAQSVTGSMHLLTTNSEKILLDCGLFQGKRNESFERNRNIPFDPASVDTMILSHAHIDHSGNIPQLVKQGFTGALEDALDNMLKATTGWIQIDQEHVDEQIEELQEKIELEEYRLTKREARLIAQYANLEKTLTLLQSQMSALNFGNS